MIISTLLVAQWFAKFRGRAMAVVQLGGAASNALFPPLALSLIVTLGWRDTYRVLGGALWLILIPLSIFVVRNRPESLDLHVDGIAPVTPPSLEMEPEPTVLTNDASSPPQLWRTRQFWLIALPLVAAPFLITALIFHQTSIFAGRGLPPTVAAAAFAPMAVTSALVATITGVVVDRVGPRNVLFGSLGLLFLALLQLQFLNSTAGASIYSMTLGCVLGTTGVVGGVIWPHYYGREGLGRIQGTASMVAISAAAMAPLPLASLQQASGSYTLGLGLYALLPLVCAMILTQLKAQPHADIAACR